MTDRELLELAAKAAGIEIYFRLDRGQLPFNDICCLVNTTQHWNPLTDDGDALRLAVKLNLHIHIDFDLPKNEVRVHQVDTECAEKGDPYAATRRAIVRAAAEIGKGMK